MLLIFSLLKNTSSIWKTMSEQCNFKRMSQILKYQSQGEANNLLTFLLHRVDKS